MGLKENSSKGGGRWLQLNKGKFKIKDGNTEYEYAELEGRVSDIFFKDETYENQKYRAVVFTIEDGSDTYKFSTSMSSGYGTSILFKLPNVQDLTRPISFEPSYSEDGGKKKSSVFVSQDGKPIKQYWTKDCPRDLPEMESAEAFGKKVYSSDKRNAYLEKYIMEEIVPKLKKSSGSTEKIVHDAPEESGEEIPF